MATPAQGVQRVDFEGETHEFPPDFTDADISRALGARPGAAAVADPQAPHAPHSPADPSLPSVGAAGPPSLLERLNSVFPILDRLRATTPLHERSATMPTAQAVAKPLTGTQNEQAISPELAMTSAEQRQHPILTGAGEFAGGMTTPDNLLMSMMLAGKLPAAIARPLGVALGTSMLSGAAQQWQPLKSALDARDWPEVERRATHLVLGAYFGGSATARGVAGESGVPVWEDIARRGQAILDMSRRAKSLTEIDKGATLLYNKEIKEPLLAVRERLKQDGVRSLAPALQAEQQRGGKLMIPADAIAAVARATEETGYHPSPREAAVLSRISTDPMDGLARGLGYSNAAEAEMKMGSPTWEQVKRAPVTAGQAPPQGLSLDDAIKLRTDLGALAAKAERASNAKGAKVLWTAYNSVGDAIGGRVETLLGDRRAFTDYNRNFKSAFELERGFTGDLTEPILDNHEARAKLRTFADADLSQVIDSYLKPKGIDSRPLQDAQASARSLLEAHSAIMGKFQKGLYRQVLSGTPSEALAPLGVYMMARGAGLYGFVPYLLASMAGKVTGGMSSEVEAGRILRKLDIPENRAYLQLRSLAPGPVEAADTPPAASRVQHEPFWTPWPDKEIDRSEFAYQGPPDERSTSGKAAAIQSLRDVAQPERDTNTLKAVQAEHPEWTLSQQLQEAARRVRK